jgi:hypothetical protein
LVVATFANIQSPAHDAAASTALHACIHHPGDLCLLRGIRSLVE